MKKYRLKKDLPDAKAGTELRPDKNEELYYYTTSDGKYDQCFYNREYVENNPDWFELIKDKKTFQPGDMIRVKDSHWACGGERGFVMSKVTYDSYRLCLERTGSISGIAADQMEPETNFHGYGEKNPSAKWTDEHMRIFAHYFSWMNYDRVPKMHELSRHFKNWVKGMDPDATTTSAWKRIHDLIDNTNFQKGGHYRPVGDPEPCVFINCTTDHAEYFDRMQAINKECAAGKRAFIRENQLVIVKSTLGQEIFRATKSRPMADTSNHNITLRPVVNPSKYPLLIDIIIPVDVPFNENDI